MRGVVAAGDKKTANAGAIILKNGDHFIDKLNSYTSYRVTEIIPNILYNQYYELTLKFLESSKSKFACLFG